MANRRSAMRERTVTMLNLISNNHRLERVCILLEIRLNHLLFDHNPADAVTITYQEFLAQLTYDDCALYKLLQPHGEAEQAVEWVRSKFKSLADERDSLPFPILYNADKSLALLSYGLVRHLRPERVLETGVGYGITSALVLHAMENTNYGELISIDLPPLSDPKGSSTGLAVP